MNNNEPGIPILSRVSYSALTLGAAGVTLSVLAWYGSKSLFMQSWYFAVIFWTSLTLGCFGIMLLHHTLRGIWGIPLLRFVEAGAKMLPLVALMWFPVLLSGMDSVFPWARHDALENPVMRHRYIWMNEGAVTLRWALYFALWIFLASKLNRWSVLEDETGNHALAQKRTNLAAPSLVLYVITVSLAMTDWVMSLYPEWESTIFGLLFVVGQGLGGLAFSILSVSLLSGIRPWLNVLNPRLYKDFGNMMLTFVILWAYMSFSQYLLIWSANLPSEISFYVVRSHGGWWWMGNALIFFQFFVPFMLLLSSKTKRTPLLLAFTAGWILVMRVVDIYWIVMPAFRPMSFAFHWQDLAAFCAIGGLWCSGVFYMFMHSRFIPTHDARIDIAMGMRSEVTGDV